MRIKRKNLSTDIKKFTKAETEIFLVNEFSTFLFFCHTFCAFAHAVIYPSSFLRAVNHCFRSQNKKMCQKANARWADKKEKKALSKKTKFSCDRSADTLTRQTRRPTANSGTA